MTWSTQPPVYNLKGRTLWSFCLLYLSIALIVNYFIDYPNKTCFFSIMCCKGATSDLLFVFVIYFLMIPSDSVLIALQFIQPSSSPKQAPH